MQNSSISKPSFGICTARTRYRRRVTQLRGQPRGLEFDFYKHSDKHTVSLRHWQAPSRTLTSQPTTSKQRRCVPLSPMPIVAPVVTSRLFFFRAVRLPARLRNQISDSDQDDPNVRELVDRMQKYHDEVEKEFTGQKARTWGKGYSLSIA